MDQLFHLMPPLHLLAALSMAVLAGVVKGLVGFAMPMVLISGLGVFLAPDVALAGLILPTLVTNVMQALGQGGRAAVESIQRFRIFLAVGLICMLSSAQLVPILPADTLLLLIGVPVAIFATLQLLGWRLRLRGPTARVEAAVGATAGLIGGMSGVWGPPTVSYLTAINTQKADQMRIQGVIYGLGAVALFGAHLASGVMRAETLPFSVALIPPAMLGMWIGGRFQKRIDQSTFRRFTLVVLLIAGFNLVRRALIAG